MLGHPIDELDRFFPAPRKRHAAPPSHDAQRAALERVLERHARLAPHLESPEALARFLERQSLRRRLEQRISVALALCHPHDTHVLGAVGPTQLRDFQLLARQRPELAAWVFA